jgi:hypothetical protein
MAKRKPSASYQGAKREGKKRTDELDAKKEDRAYEMGRRRLDKAASDSERSSRNRNVDSEMEHAGDKVSKEERLADKARRGHETSESEAHNQDLDRRELEYKREDTEGRRAVKRDIKGGRAKTRQMKRRQSKSRR